jgi:hypothetical protein
VQGASWTDPLTMIPGAGSMWTSFWVSYSWSQAIDATNGLFGLWNFKPKALFELWLPGVTPDPSQSQFAVGEDNYFMILT